MASTRPGDKQPTDPDGPSGYADLQEDIQCDKPMHEVAKINVKGGSNVTVESHTRAELVRLPCIKEVSNSETAIGDSIEEYRCASTVPP